ncbi:MAG: DUF2769 domain-containing protein [Methanobacterium formicicum]|jgi:hypothetical protein|uniref:DUF2769 domain-containing protein n=1 Tax=Methanobacterium formicicum TaxID=2162 RepID=A0A0S4FLK8_METFO|nr:MULTISPECIES: DUF2769 domain-containing protein [Methanobacterium]MDD4811386.1 DUF2769 domain-containing protein [Methanobacterium formicicum]MDG3546830.1 DUF2769 domain-containing protein [Methanobacterium formicicum]CEL23866.1 hypothetical protein MB9_0211 [Methanobacterium formicicum]
MDKFEEKMGELASEGLSDEEIGKKLLDEMGDLCICPDCPMYNQCAEKNYEGLYCILGLSKCKLEEDDCICQECEVAEELELKNDLFCITGPEKELRGL